MGIVVVRTVQRYVRPSLVGWPASTSISFDPEGELLLRDRAIRGGASVCLHGGDLLRQNLFEVRDSLFDDARAGKIAFDSPAYRNTRLMLNGMIRFGHRPRMTPGCLGRSAA